MPSLADSSRPRTWSEVVGQDDVLARIDLLRPRGLGGRAYFLTGASGTGKSTIARLLAGELADPMNVETVEAASMTPATVHEMERVSCLYGMGSRNGRAFIVEEVHGLRSDTVRALLVVLERIPAHVLWTFTTTTDGEEELFEKDDAAPLLSRCIRLRLASQGIAETYARYVWNLAQREGLAGTDPARALQLVRRHRNNLRAVLQAVETGDLL